MGMIKVRAKKMPSVDGGGDPPSGTWKESMVMAGTVFEIPDDPVPHEDYAGRKIYVSHARKPSKDGGVPLTEKERREYHIQNRLIHTMPGFYPGKMNQAAMQGYDIQQETAYLKYKNFSPVWMEIVPMETPLSNEAGDNGWGTAAQEEKLPDVKPAPANICEMKEPSALKLVNNTMDGETIQAWIEMEMKGEKREGLLAAMNAQLKTLYKQ